MEQWFSKFLIIVKIKRWIDIAMLGKTSAYFINYNAIDNSFEFRESQYNSYANVNELVEIKGMTVFVNVFMRS